MSRSHRRPRGSLGVARCILGIVLFASGVVALVAADAPSPTSVPRWAVLAVPPIVYAVLAPLVVRRFAVVRLLATAVGLCVLHVLLLVATETLAPSLAAILDHEVPANLSWSSPLLSVLALASVPMMLTPLRGLVVPRRRYTRPIGRRSAPAERRRAPGDAPMAPPIVSAAPTAPAQAQATARSAPATNRVAPPPSAPATSRPVPPPGAPAASAALPGVSAPAVAADSRPAGSGTRPPRAQTPPPPTPERDSSLARPPAAESIEEIVRVSFARVAAQLPSDLFRLGPERLAANLLEPGHLLVPRRLVVPQLAEGFVQVPWRVVADQFPRQAMAVRDSDVAARLPDGSLVLPLDEVVRQVPSDLFAISTPALDVRGIEDFPPPFQPHVPTPAAVRTDDEPVPPVRDEPLPDGPSPVDVTTASPEATVVEEATPIVEAALGEPEAEEPAFPAAGIEALPFDTASVEPEPAPDEDATPEPAALVPTDWAAMGVGEHAMVELVAEPPPSVRPPASLAESFVAGAQDGTRALDRGRYLDPRRVAELLARLPGAVAVETRESDGATLLTAVPPGLDTDVAVATALRLVPFLCDHRLPVAAAQATLRSETGALVVTPVAPGESRAPVVVASAATAASLALLERVSLAAVAEWRAAPEAWPAPSASRAPDPVDDNLSEAIVPSHVRAAAESLHALGPVTPTVLIDGEGRSRTYLFLARGVEPRGLGQFARDLQRALEGAEIGAVQSIVFRTGTDRLLVRPVETGRGDAAVLVAGGPVDRPGLARLELDRAAASLVAS